MNCSSRSGPLPKLEKLSPRVFRVLGCNPSLWTFQGTNTYLVGTGKRRILIDTGDYGNQSYIANLREALANQQAEVHQILVTHWHRDHLGGANDVIAKILPAEDSKTMKITKIRKEEGGDILSEAKNGYQFVGDGAILETDGATLRVVHTPGHTNDHMSLYLEEEQALFSGDCVLGVSRPVFEDLGDYHKSLSRLQSDFIIRKIYPGHGPVINDPKERIRDYLRNIERRERLIFGALRNAKKKNQGMTIEQLIDEIYLDLSFFLKPAAGISLINHLKKLKIDNRVAEVAGKWHLV